MINVDLKRYLPQLQPYTELRFQENRTNVITLVNGHLVNNEKKSVSGISARMFKEGYWGFASSPIINDESVGNVLKLAEKNALFLASKGEEKKPLHHDDAFEMHKDFGTQKKRLSQNEMLEYLKNIDDYIASTYPELSDRTLYLSALDMEKNLLTSDGTISYLNWPRTVLYVMLTIKKDGEPTEIYEAFGGRGHFEDQFASSEDVKRSIDGLYKELMQKNDGVVPTAGTHDVILDASLAGILAHEALGHTVEADLVRNGSIAGDYMNKKIASDLITLVDFAHSYKDEILPCPIFIDDEGVVSKDAYIIKEGILSSFMHNRDSAYEFDMAKTGNARAWEYSDEPLIRMRNTCILPGDSKLEDMIASIEDGYYFTKTSNGQADTTGEFMFGVTAGYEIKGGKLGRAIKDTTISGKAFDVLSSVTMVSDDMKWSAGGMCGKKQPIPTGMGGPAIKCKIHVGGQ